MSTHKITCLKSSMGDWTYYLFTLPFQDAEQILKFAHQVNKKTDLDHLIQRELTTRSSQIAEYLSTQPQRLFGSLICASFGEAIQYSGKNGLGVVTLSEKSMVYVLDGQHRLAAIQEALKKNPSRYAGDNVAILLVEHLTTDAGYKRARRLFTTVNRYAKQTSKPTNRIMEEDDGNSFLLLRFIREFVFYSLHIKCSRKNKKGQRVLFQSESMGKTDAKYLMSVSSFYEVIHNLIPTANKPLFHPKKKTQMLPSVADLDDAYGEVDIRLDEIIEAVEPWKQLKSGTISDVGHLRGKAGGHPLVRPVCIIPFALAFNEAREAGVSVTQLRKLIEKYSDITAKPWNGVLWDDSRKRMFGGQEVKRLTGKLWRLIFGLATPPETVATTAEWRARVDPLGVDPTMGSPLL